MCVCFFYLANPLALHNKSLHLWKIVVVGNHICDDRFFIWILCVYICTRWKGVQRATPPATSQQSRIPGKTKMNIYITVSNLGWLNDVSPSGSKSLVRPRCCSATLKANWRLWVAFERVSLWNSIRSGLKETTSHYAFIICSASLIHPSMLLPLYLKQLPTYACV